jgi:hypothetical protein
VSNQVLGAISIASFCAGIIVVALFDSKLSLFIAILLVGVGGMTPLAVFSRRKGTDI